MARRTQRVSSHPCRLPAEVSSRHESSVEARLAEGRGRFAADVKSIDAEGDDRLLLREFANPFVHALGRGGYGALPTFIRSSAARRPLASFWGSSLPQKCMKNIRGSSLSMWL